MARYIPETQKEQEVMLEKIGLSKIDDLYSMVPEEVKLKELDLPEGKSEYEVLEELKSIAAKNTVYRSIFRGAGAYNHYVPSAVDAIANKEEFLTAYTPYQA